MTGKCVFCFIFVEIWGNYASINATTHVSLTVLQMYCVCCWKPNASLKKQEQKLIVSLGFCFHSFLLEFWIASTDMFAACFHMP